MTYVVFKMLHDSYSFKAAKNSGSSKEEGVHSGMRYIMSKDTEVEDGVPNSKHNK